jgi:hypothetical protein
MRKFLAFTCNVAMTLVELAAAAAISLLVAGGFGPEAGVAVGAIIAFLLAVL